jgi:hypothetical protein
MNAFFEHHKDSILFGYRCFDRVLLDRRPSLDLAVLAAWTGPEIGEQFPSGLIQPFQQPERVIGFSIPTGRFTR